MHPPPAISKHTHTSPRPALTVQVEALQQMGRHTDAMQALLAGAARSPAFASSQEYHQLVVHVERALHAQHVRQ